jgi:hypothetical protein
MQTFIKLTRLFPYCPIFEFPNIHRLIKHSFSELPLGFIVEIKQPEKKSVWKKYLTLKIEKEILLT